MRHVWIVVLLVPLAGCADVVEGARQGADDAGELVAAARQEAKEAKDRLDRLRSLDALREERVRLTVRPELDAGALGFLVVEAARSDGRALPATNLTRLPSLALETETGFAFSCDPGTCRATLPANGTLAVFWLDAPSNRTILRPGFLPDLTLEGAKVLATTRVADIAD